MLTSYLLLSTQHSALSTASGQIFRVDEHADEMGRIGHVTAVGVIDKEDAAVLALDPGRIAMIGIGLLRRVIGMNLDQAVALVLVGPLAAAG